MSIEEEKWQVYLPLHLLHWALIFPFSATKTPNFNATTTPSPTLRHHHSTLTFAIYAQNSRIQKKVYFGLCNLEYYVFLYSKLCNMKYNCVCLDDKVRRFCESGTRGESCCGGGGCCGGSIRGGGCSIEKMKKNDERVKLPFSFFYEEVASSYNFICSCGIPLTYIMLEIPFCK